MTSGTAAAAAAAGDADADDVYPTGRIDNALSIKPMVLSLTLRFDDVLDAAKLHAALCTLLGTGDWRRLGGRLRKPPPARGSSSSSSSVLEIHVPRVFTADRPPVAFSHEDLSDTPVAQHPLGRDLPAVGSGGSGGGGGGGGTEAAALYHPGEHFRAFAAAPDFPDTVDGFLTSTSTSASASGGAADRPVLSLRVTSFRDATLVAVGAPHLLVDAMALGELLRAWSLVLAGRLDEVPPVLGARDDILYDAAADPAAARTKDGGGEEGEEEEEADEEREEEPWALQHVYLTGFAFFLFLVRFVWGLLTERTIESRVVFLPRRVAARMREAALADLLAKDGAAEPAASASAAAWVSEGDVLFAWACRVVSLGQGASPRPLNAHNALNLRGRLPETTAVSGSVSGSGPGPGSGRSPCGVYARNLITLSYMPVSVAEARGPLGLLAAKYRAALATQARPAQARWAVRAARAAVDAGKDANVVCGDPPTGELLSMTNWLKADVAGAADFSPAVVVEGVVGGQQQQQPKKKKGEDEDRKHTPGRIVYVHSQLHAQSTLVRNTLGVVGKDQHGGIWMQGFFPPRTWAALQRELDELNAE
ncbi:hypothetical protein V2A60_001275 [Cordyceps javanica]